MSGRASLLTWKLTSSQATGSIVVGAPPSFVNTLLSAWPARSWLDTLLDGPALPAQARIIVPVASLEGPSLAMVEDARMALKGDVFQHIYYEFLEVEEVSAVTSRNTGPDSELRMRTKGVLSIAGRSRIVSAAVSAKRSAASLIRLRGTIQLSLKDFDIEPPAHLFGLIRAADQVEVGFTLFLQSTPPAS